MLFLCQLCCVPSLPSNFSLCCYNLMFYFKKAPISFSCTTEDTRYVSVLGVNARVWVAGAGAVSCGEEAANCPVPVPAGSSRFGKLVGTSATQGVRGAAAQACLRESSSREGPQLRVIHPEQSSSKKRRPVEEKRKKQGVAERHRYTLQRQRYTLLLHPLPKGLGGTEWNPLQKWGILRLGSREERWQTEAMPAEMRRCFPKGLFHCLVVFFPQ